MHDEEVIIAIDRIEDAPIADRILGHTGQIRCNGIMTQIGDVRGQPLGFVEQSLSEVFLQWRQVRDDIRCEGEAIPRHGALPTQSQLFSHRLAGDPRLRRE